MRYKFRYYNGSMKFLSAFVVSFQNFFLTAVACFVIYFILAKIAGLLGLENYLFNNNVWSIVKKIIFILAFIYAIVYIVSKKGVFLYDEGFEIARYTITPLNWKNRIYVSFNEVESINVNYYNIRYTKYRYSMLVPLGDDTYNIELTLKNGKKYFFSIEDQEEFVEEVSKRMEKIR